jgi:UDPglucose--hexose-1-phosphate uridylyltransferase
MMVERMSEHLGRSGQTLIGELAAAELSQGTRLVAVAPSALAFVPPFARFPYEIWIVPRRSVPYLSGLSAPERSDVAAMLSSAVRRLYGLWKSPVPYLMTFDQGPTDGLEHPEWTLHIAIRPIQRDRGRLKYLAGTELGAGVFVNDVLPEHAARRLRNVDLGTSDL